MSTCFTNIEFFFITLIFLFVNTNFIVLMMQSYDGIQAIPTYFMFFAPGYYDKGAKSMTLLLTPI